jgi:hypothetical protein
VTIRRLLPANPELRMLVSRLNNYAETGDLAGLLDPELTVELRAGRIRYPNLAGLDGALCRRVALVAALLRQGQPVTGSRG